MPILGIKMPYLGIAHNHGELHQNSGGLPPPPQCRPPIGHANTPTSTILATSDTRHTTATLLLKQREPLAVVSKHPPALPKRRHHLERYGHLDLDDQRRTVNALKLEAPLPPVIEAKVVRRVEWATAQLFFLRGAPGVRTVDEGGTHEGEGPRNLKESEGLLLRGYPPHPQSAPPAHPAEEGWAVARRLGLDDGR